MCCGRLRLRSTPSPDAANSAIHLDPAKNRGHQGGEAELESRGSPAQAVHATRWQAAKSVPKKEEPCF